MSSNAIDLCGKVCPYPVVEVVREVDRMRSGETLRCVVDDPLAIKAVPEELEDYTDISLSIGKHSDGWEIIVVKE